MVSLTEQIEEVEEEIHKTPYNKATQHHIGKLKAKLSKLRELQLQRMSGGGGGDGYGVRRTGDATVVLVGLPSVGKSSLLNQLTNADSPVGAYEFTTLKVIPGMMEYRGARIQLLDLPGLVRGASSGRGRGREVLSMVRNSDLVIFIADVFSPEKIEILRRELYDSGIRLDEKPPDVNIKRTERGGVIFSSTVELDVSEEEMRAVLSEYKIHNALVLIRESLDLDRFIDVLQGNRIYVPSLTVLNKSDLIDDKQVPLPGALCISAESGEGLNELRDTIYSKLDFIEIFMKKQGEQTDYDEPLIIRKNATVGEVCDWVHQEFKNKFRYARVWGSSVRHDGQRVGLEHVLENEDILSIIVRK